MKYFYYPGCSLEGTAVEYNESTRAVLRALGAELVEIEDWTCCGASAGDVGSHLLSMVLPARNLALAEQADSGVDVVIPCSACYLNLKKVEDHTRRDDGLLRKVNLVLGDENLRYTRQNKPRHLLEVLAKDIGPVVVGERVHHPLRGLRVVPYYGCQVLRPYRVFDDPEEPRSMEPLIEALGAEVFSWSMGAKCCGAGLMTTKKPVAMEMVGALLKAAKGADCIVTVCPMCQMNLECFQKKASGMLGEDLSISVLYLPQLMGIAFGLAQNELKLQANIAYTKPLQSRIDSLLRGGISV
ncbi:MAG: disulfide reductase [Syntrophobacteraceae bacterium]|nr:disulfide reductase [Syntrophobacteraceae bacterium]